VESVPRALIPGKMRELQRFVGICNYDFQLAFGNI
jgi:hypothetical protein